MIHRPGPKSTSASKYDPQIGLTLYDSLRDGLYGPPIFGIGRMMGEMPVGRKVLAPAVSAPAHKALVHEKPPAPLPASTTIMRPG